MTKMTEYGKTRKYKGKKMSGSMKMKRKKRGHAMSDTEKIHNQFYR